MTALLPGLIFECADQANRIQAAPGNTVTWLRVDRREFLNHERTNQHANWRPDCTHRSQRLPPYSPIRPSTHRANTNFRTSS